jgi:hypothetical protein
MRAYSAREPRRQPQRHRVRQHPIERGLALERWQLARIDLRQRAPERDQLGPGHLAGGRARLRPEPHTLDQEDADDEHCEAD